MSQWGILTNRALRPNFYGPPSFRVELAEIARDAPRATGRAQCVGGCPNAFADSVRTAPNSNAYGEATVGLQFPGYN